MIQQNIPNTTQRKSKLNKCVRRFKKEHQLWLISIPLIIWVLVFCYYPMYGLLMAFVNYIPGKPILDGQFVGLMHFQQFIKSPEFYMVMRNTIAISGLNILIGFPAPIILALLLNEVRNMKFKKFIQTTSYLPHFISWVVTASIAFVIVGNEGLVNDILLSLGFIDKPISFLGTGKYFWSLITGLNIWKGVGWASIIYLSAIAGVDKELYQAGAVDGLGRFGKIWHITLPGIRTTIILLLIISMGSILNAGFEQQLLIGNPQTREYYEVLDTYAYKYGIQLGNYSYATAIGLFKSIIGVTLLFTVNKIAKKYSDTSII